MNKSLTLVKEKVSPEHVKIIRQEVISLAVESAKDVLRALVDQAINEGNVAAARLVLEVAGLAGKGGVMLLQQFNAPFMTPEEIQAIKADLDL